MKVIIVYFSGTGVTAKFAEEIALGYSGQGHDVRMYEWNKIDPSVLAEGDLLGFGCPVYSFYAPRPFLRFLKTLPVMVKPFFLFATCHSMEGITLWGMYRILTKKGLIFNGITRLGLGINNIRAWRPKKNSLPEMDSFIGLEEARETGAAASAAMKSGFFYKLFILLFTWPWQMAMVEGFFKKVRREVCTRCGLCYDVICPVGAIKNGRDRYPDFRPFACVGCGGCVNLCPAEALYTLFNKNRQPFTMFAKYRLKSLK